MRAPVSLDQTAHCVIAPSSLSGSMADFMILSEDVADGPAIRAATRQNHLDWLKTPSDCTVLSAGPWLDDTNAMRGSLLIVKAPSREALDLWMADDPYIKAGLPKHIDVRPFKLVIGRPDGL